MNQAEAFVGVQRRESFQPSQTFFTDACERGGNRLLDHGKNWRELRMCGGIFSHTFRGPKHLVGIPADPGPSERADLIDDFRRVSSPGGQIAAMDNQVRRNLPQVGENGLEGAPIAVNVRYDRDSHLSSSRFLSVLLGLARRDRFQGLHIPGNLGGNLVLSNLQVVARLEIHPESREFLK